MKTFFRRLALLAGLSAAPFAGAVSAYDITSIQTSLTDVTGQIILVGLAVIGVYVAIKAYKWIRRAL